MREKLWLFIAKFVLASLILFALWYFTGALERRGANQEPGWYLMFLNHLMSFLLIKVAGLNIQYFPAPKPILLNLIPFISLMIITKDIEWKARLYKLILGLVILIGWHMLLTMLVYLLHDEPGVPSPIYEKLSVPLYLFSGTLPFILWILFASRQVAWLFSRKKKKIK
jgi:hypothetical protein